MSGRPRGGFHPQHGGPRPSQQHPPRGAPAADPRSEEVIFRKVRGILNKLTIEKFDPLVQQLLCIGITAENVLKGIIILLFEKALDEPKFSSMYAKVCSRLAAEGPDFEPPNEDGSKAKTPTFLKLLLRKCQDEFENRSKAEELAKGAGSFKELVPGSEEFRKAMAAHAELKAVRTKMLGNIRFIGELGKNDLLSERVLHSCIQQLLADVESPAEEDVECLCLLLKTVGFKLDHAKARGWIDQYFSRMAMAKASGTLPPRIRFMIDDVVELRENKWEQRTLQKEAGPKSIMEIRLEAHEDQAKAIGNSRERAVRLQRIQRMREQMRLGKIGGMGIDGRELGFGGTHEAPHVPMMPREHGVPSSPGMFSGMQQQDFYGGPRPSGGFVGHGPPGGGPHGGPPHHGEPPRQGGPPQYGGPQHHRGQGPPHHMQMYQQQRGRGGPSHGDFRRYQQMGQLPQGGGGGLSLRPTTGLGGRRGGPPQHQTESAAAMGPPPPPSHSVPLAMQGRAPIAPAVQKGKGKKKKLSKEELVIKSTAVLEEFFGIADVAEATTCFKELGTPKHVGPFVAQCISMSLDRKEGDRDNAVMLVTHLHKEGLIETNKLVKMFEALLPEVDDLAIDIPLAKKHLGYIASKLVILDLLTLPDFLEPLRTVDDGGDGGPSDHKLLGYTLGYLVELDGEEKMTKRFADADMNLADYLPTHQRSEASILEFASEHGFIFLFAMQAMRRQLTAELAQHVPLGVIKEGRGSPGVKAIRAWLQGQPEAVAKNDRFLYHVAYAVIGHVASSTTATAEADELKVDAPEWKELKVMEGKMIQVVVTLLRGLAMEDVRKQMLIIYGAQVWCHEHGNPKGLMLRTSGHLYDLDVVEEPAFREWREEVTDEFPGKGNALIAINEYLDWMRTVEEEETDEEESDEE